MPKERIPSPGGMNLLARLISRIKSGLGIVEETNTATHTIAAGKYVTWKGNVYRAKSAIPSGTTLSSSNLETLSDGGLNDLSGALNSNLTGFKDKFTFFSGSVTLKNNSMYFIAIRGFSSVTKWGGIFTALGGYDAYKLAGEGVPSRNGFVYTFTMDGVPLVRGVAIELLTD